MQAMTVWLIVAYVAGVVVSIVFPYALAWVEAGEPFDWRMNVGRVLTALLALLPMVGAADFIEQLGVLGYFGAFVLGLGFSQIGRMAQKTTAIVGQPGAGVGQ